MDPITLYKGLHPSPGSLTSVFPNTQGEDDCTDDIDGGYDTCCQQVGILLERQIETSLACDFNTLSAAPNDQGPPSPFLGTSPSFFGKWEKNQACCYNPMLAKSGMCWTLRTDSESPSHLTHPLTLCAWANSSASLDLIPFLLSELSPSLPVYHPRCSDHCTTPTPCHAGAHRFFR